MDEAPDGEDADPADGRTADSSGSGPQEGLGASLGSWSIGTLSADDADLPWVVDALGQLGIYLGVVAVGLAVLGLVAGALDVFSVASVAILFSIVLASIGMGLAIVFQFFVMRA